MQFVMPIHKTWSLENIDENINLLRSRIKWKNFYLEYDKPTYEQKGYIVIDFSYDEPMRKSTIHIWRNKVEITSKNWKDISLSAVILSYILSEKGKSIFLESLFQTFGKTGEFDRQYQEMGLEILKSQYLDLVEGKVPEELLQNTKEMVRSTLELMLKVVEEIH